MLIIGPIFFFSVALGVADLQPFISIFCFNFPIVSL